jgi:hypothetical protein
MLVMFFKDEINITKEHTNCYILTDNAQNCEHAHLKCRHVIPLLNAQLISLEKVIQDMYVNIFQKCCMVYMHEDNKFLSMHEDKGII